MSVYTQYAPVIEASSLTRTQKRMIGMLLALCDDKGCFFGTLEALRVACELPPQVFYPELASFRTRPAPILIEVTTAMQSGVNRGCLRVVGPRS